MVDSVRIAMLVNASWLSLAGGGMSIEKAQEDVHGALSTAGEGAVGNADIRRCSEAHTPGSTSLAWEDDAGSDEVELAR
jgi:hypothetical protein